MNTEATINPEQEDASAAIPAHAGFWLRFFAFLIDLSFIQVVEKILSLLFGSWISNLFQSGAAVTGDIIWDIILSLLVYCLSIFLTGLIYFIGFEMSPFFATPGKFIMGIYVTDDQYAQATPIKIVLRNIARILCYFTFGIGYCMAGFTTAKQGLHDMVAGTAVLKTQSVVDQQRTFGIVFAVLLFIAVSLLLPTEVSTSGKSNDPATSSAEGDEIDPLASTSLTPSEQTIPFPDNQLGYLQTQVGITKFVAVHARTELVERTTSSQSGVFSEKLRKLTFAFFAKSLSDSDHNILRKTSDFFVDPKKKIGQPAVFTVELMYPSYLQVCHADRITSAIIEFDPLALPQLSPDATEKLRISIDPQQLFSEDKFYSECSELTDSATFKLALQGTFQPSNNVPPILTNLRINEPLKARFIKHVNQYDGGKSAFAIWHNSEKQLTLGIFNDPLSTGDKKTFFKTGRVNSGTQQPTTVVTFSAPEARQRLMRDQVIQQTITFFRQPTGPLSFPDGIEKITARLSGRNRAMPILLTALIKNGERVTGKLSGRKIVESANGDDYHLHWNIPFNATLIVKK